MTCVDRCARYGLRLKPQQGATSRTRLTVKEAADRWNGTCFVEPGTTASCELQLNFRLHYIYRMGTVDVVLHLLQCRYLDTNECVFSSEILLIVVFLTSLRSGFILLVIRPQATHKYSE